MIMDYEFEIVVEIRVGLPQLTSLETKQLGYVDFEEVVVYPKSQSIYMLSKTGRHFIPLDFAGQDSEVVSEIFEDILDQLPFEAKELLVKYDG